MAQNLGVKRPSIMSLFRLSNKFKRTSQKSQADRMRASNGKLVMMPSMKAIVQVKKSMKHTEMKRESFLKQLELNRGSPVTQE